MDSITRNYETSGVSMLDLVQEGSLGLAHAAEHFDPTTSFRFASFASWWIREFILRAIAGRQK